MTKPCAVENVASAGEQHGLPDDPAALKRIVMRHVRWRQEALGLLQRVNPKWPELVEFLDQSTARLVRSDRHD